MNRPRVDIVIPTIGRASLAQAALAACVQTYPGARTIVIGDGPGTGAVDIVESVRNLVPTANLVYYETASRLGGYGDFVKRWWIDHDDAGEWIRFLDDDDWIPPCAIAEMVGRINPDTTLVLCGMVMVLAAPFNTKKSGGRHEFRGAALKPHHANSGTCMIRTDCARRTKFPTGALADFELCKAVASMGDHETSALPLYFYNGHQGGKVPTVHAKPTSPYPPRWPFKPPRTFRKTLFNRVPLANYFKPPDGTAWLVYDQALLRPMDRLARKRAWICDPAYSYKPAPASTKCYTLRDCRTDMLRLIQRGFVNEGEYPKPVEPRDGAPPVHWIIPAYQAKNTIGRAIQSIATQIGDWECTISVDGNDAETAGYAVAAIGDDRRFRVVVKREHLMPLRNVLAALDHVGDNQIVALCDADDYLLRANLTQELLGLYHDPDIEIVCGTNAAMVMRKER